MRSLPRLSERVESTRKLLSRPRYQPLGVREFHVNEIMGHRIQFKLGAAVGYFSERESAELTWRSSGAGRTAGDG